MDKLFADLVSFFAVWFNTFKTHVFKVQVVGSTKGDTQVLEQRLKNVSDSLEIAARSIEKSSASESLSYLKNLGKSIGGLVTYLQNTKNVADVSTLKPVLLNIERAVSKIGIKGPISISNLPETQKVKGEVTLSNMDKMIAGLQVVVDKLGDLEFNMVHELQESAKVYMGQTGSRAALKITDGDLTATITEVGSDKAIDVNVVQTVGGGGGGGSATEYTEGGTDTTFTGPVILAEGPSDTATPLQVDSSKLLQIDIAADSSGLATSTKQDTIIGHVDGIETLIGTTNTNTGNSATSLAILDDWDESDRAKVNTIVGNAGVTGNTGTVDAGTQRVVLATNVALPAGTNNIGDVDVLSSALPTGASTLGEQQSQTTHLATIAGDTTDIEAAVELIDDIIFAEDVGHTTGDKGAFILAVRNSALSALTNTDGDYSPIAVNSTGAVFSNITNSTGSSAVNVQDGGNSLTVDYATTGSGTATGALRVELPTNGTGVIATVSAVTAITNALPAGTNAIGKLAANSGVDIGDTDVTSIVPGTGATNLGKARDGASGSTDTGVALLAVRDDALSALTPIEGDYDVLRITSSGALWIEGQYDADIRTAVQLIDDAIVADDAAFTPATTKVMMAGFQADEGSTDSVNEGDAGAARMTLDRKQIVTVQPHTQDGLSVFNATSSDGGTALTSTAQAVKASAGQVYGWYIYNPNSTAQFVQFYNTAAASVTVGTTNPLFMLTIPATAAANVEFTNGIQFTNAGFSIAATSTAGGNGAPTTALDAVIMYK